MTAIAGYGAIIRVRLQIKQNKVVALDKWITLLSPAFRILSDLLSKYLRAIDWAAADVFH